MTAALRAQDRRAPSRCRTQTTGLYERVAEPAAQPRNHNNNIAQLVVAAEDSEIQQPQLVRAQLEERVAQEALLALRERHDAADRLHAARQRGDAHLGRLTHHQAPHIVELHVAVVHHVVLFRAVGAPHAHAVMHLVAAAYHGVAAVDGVHARRKRGAHPHGPAIFVAHLV
ncbi:hypothetical protein FGB62_17g447 [Gracilaria domingensis]|nr:hypothetical protein FGB62_17g447 [Gracilaria domingensis]